MFDSTKTPEPALIKRLIAAYIVKLGGHPMAEDIKAEFAYWEALFKEYNETVPPPAQFPNSRMGMSCYPCYMKVYLWHKSKHVPGSEIT